MKYYVNNNRNLYYLLQNMLIFCKKANLSTIANSVYNHSIAK